MASLPEGGMRIEGFDREMAEVVYMVGYTSLLTLNIGARAIRLDSLDGAGQPVRISIEEISVWELWRGL
jgi:hypothetical protein